MGPTDQIGWDQARISTALPRAACGVDTVFDLRGMLKNTQGELSAPDPLLNVVSSRRYCANERDTPRNSILKVKRCSG